MSVKMILVDDHRMFRDGMRLLLQKEPDFSIVAEASDARGARDRVEQTPPDLLIIDIQLPDGNGIDVARAVLEAHPEIKVLVVSGDPDLSRVNEALQAGVSGYLLKDEPSDELLRAVRTVMTGNVYLCPAAATALAQGLRSNPNLETEADKPRLSPQELQVLRLVAEGLRNKEIADQLKVSTKSVETYRSRLMTKVGCSSTAELVRYAVREGIAAL